MDAFAALVAHVAFVLGPAADEQVNHSKGCLVLSAFA